MPIRLIYVVALLEGFSTLAVQLIAMRLAIPVVGSSIVLTSVFLGVILLALSAGYYSGGIVSSKRSHEKLVHILGLCLLVSGVWYVAIGFMFERQLLEYLLASTQAYVLTLFLLALILFFVPVFLASHTIPLLTELLKEDSKGKAAGNMLFISTIGSFLGSVVTSTVLFELRGVTLTGVAVGVMLCGLAGVTFWSAPTISRRWIWLSVLLGLALCGGYMGVTGDVQAGERDIYSFDSAYQQIRVYDREIYGQPSRVFSTNGALSSAIYLDGPEQGTSPFKYVREAVLHTERLLASRQASGVTDPIDILVIGAAGFVYPMEVAAMSEVAVIDTVDIDPSVYEIAQEYFFQTPLDEKIVFHPYSARFVIHQMIKQNKTYDLIFLDAYNGKSLPDELVTQEFFTDIQTLLGTNEGVEPGTEGLLVANLILDSRLESPFAHHALATMGSVFGFAEDDLTIANITNNPGYPLDNMMVINTAAPGYTPISMIIGDERDVIYTDDRSRAEKEGVAMLYGNG